MSSFDKYTNYQDNAGVSSVVFGAEKPVLEVEMNEMQEIQKNTLRNFIKGVIGDGIAKFLDMFIFDDTKSQVRIRNNTFVADGWVIKVDVEGGIVLIDCVEGDTVYLRVWEETVTFNDELKKMGQQTFVEETIPNWFKDSRVSEETSRRKVVKFDFAIEEDPNKYNLPVTRVKNKCPVQLCREVNLGNLYDQYRENLYMQPNLSILPEGVLGVYVDIETDTFRRVGDNADWKPGEDYNKSPIYGGRVRCNLSDRGEVVSYYGDGDYTEGGYYPTADKQKTFLSSNRPDMESTRTVTRGENVQAMVMQPKFYYRRIPLKIVKQDSVVLAGEPTDGSFKKKGYYMTKWVDLISPTPQPGFKVHPAFIDGKYTDNGKEVDSEVEYYFIGENQANIQDNGAYVDTQNGHSLGYYPYDGMCLSSIAGYKPAVGMNYPFAHQSQINKIGLNRGMGFQNIDLPIKSAEIMLFLIEYAALNPRYTGDFGIGITQHEPSYFISGGGKKLVSATYQPENTTLGNDSGKIATPFTQSDGIRVTEYTPVFRGVKNFFGNANDNLSGAFVKVEETGDVTKEMFYQPIWYEYYDGRAGHENDFPYNPVRPLGISIGYNSSNYSTVLGYSKEGDWCYIPIFASKVVSIKSKDSGIACGSQHTLRNPAPGNYYMSYGGASTNGKTAGLLRHVTCSILDVNPVSKIETGRLCFRNIDTRIISKGRVPKETVYTFTMTGETVSTPASGGGYVPAP